MITFEVHVTQDCAAATSTIMSVLVSCLRTRHEDGRFDAGIHAFTAMQVQGA
jgi:hypothetical protein